MRIETKAKRIIEKMLDAAGYERFSWVSKEVRAVSKSDMSSVAYVSFCVNDNNNKARITGIAECFSPALVSWNNKVIVDCSK